MKDHKESLILDHLLDDIVSGKYRENDKLPSENELADLYHATRITIRKVYNRLEEMGYLYSKQGKGRYLKDKQQKIDLHLSGSVSFSEKMKGKGYDFYSKNLFCQEIEYNEKIYSELGIEESDKVYKIGRLRFINNKPIALHVSYVAQSVFKEIHREGEAIKSMFEYYRSKGYKKFDSSKNILSVSFPTHFEREIFECTNLIPMLILEGNCLDMISGKILEFSKIIYRGDVFKYQIK
ncbi:MAG: GntR family transcriptional regulator [Clostridia bacterium]|nr:GntR family transcriptional regulator [Clostridia bacterium]